MFQLDSSRNCLKLRKKKEEENYLVLHANKCKRERERIVTFGRTADRGWKKRANLNSVEGVLNLSIFGLKSMGLI